MKKTRFPFLTLLAICMIWSCSSKTCDSGYPHLELADFVFDSCVNAVNDSFPPSANGMVVVGVFFESDDTIMVDQRYYFSNDGNPYPNDSTIFQIGSVTKTFTSALLAQQSAAGTINLTAPAQNYFPPIGGGTPGPVLPTTYNSSPVTITLEQLATHNGGFGRNLPDDAGTTPYLWGFTQLNSEPLYYAPGDNCYIYSNFSFGLCGLALSYQAFPAAVNYYNRYEKVVKRGLANPLNMNDTRINLSASQLSRRATAYDKNGAATSYDLKTWPFNHAGGGLYSTIKDMMIYGKEMTGEGVVLTPAELTDIFTWRNKTYRDTCAVDDPGYDAWQTLGWTENRDMVDSLGGSFSRFNKSGSTSGFSAFITCVNDTIYSESKRAFVVVLANRQDYPASTTGKNILKELFALESMISD